MNTTAQPMRYLHVDVFAPSAYAGNSLPVFMDIPGLNAAQMQAITRELRHFEAIFLTSTSEPQRFGARVFDLLEELPFAGHPVIGAAAALHYSSTGSETGNWTFDLLERTVSVTTTRTSQGYSALLDQGAAVVSGQYRHRGRIAHAFDLEESDLVPTLPVEVISTGLRYLIIPVRSEALARARINTDITPLVTDAGAQFAVLLDDAGCEIRHWNNDGVIEDVATGSAAGTIGAYRLRHCGAVSGERFTLNQGRFAGRPSRIDVEPHGTPDAIHSVKVGGSVAIVGWGMLEARP